MKTRQKKYRLAIVVASLLTILPVIAMGSRVLPTAASSKGFVHTVIETGPQLVIPDQIQGIPSLGAVIPIQYIANNNTISAITFSIDYDEDWLTLNASDGNEDGIPDAITFNVPSSFSVSATLDASDTDGELDFSIIDIAPPLTALNDSVIISIALSVGTPPQGAQALVKFSQNPSASFGSTTGQSIGGMTDDGSVLIANCHSLQTSTSPSGGGTITRLPAPNCGDQYKDGTEVTITALENPNFAFDKWSGNASGTSKSISITMNADKSVTANFVDCYSLTTGVTPSGGGTVATSPNPNCGAKYRAGTDVTLRADANEGFAFDHWSGAACSGAGSCVVAMDGNKSVTAHFIASDVPAACINVTEIPLVECAALVALYESTDGPNWQTKTGWLETDLPCTWHGIACLSSHATSIDLGTNALDGSIPPELGNLSDLKSLWLNDNQLSGNIPSELGNLVKLQDLALYRNQLSGSIPSQLGNLLNLQYLFLYNNQLSGSIPAELGNLSSLQDLDLSRNQLSGSIPAELGNLTNLTFLVLSRNQLGGIIPSELGKLVNLHYLNLGFNMLNASEPNLLAFLAEEDPSWSSTQTVAPSDVWVDNISSTSLQVAWTPTAYSFQGGYYEISYATSPNGPYAVAGTTTSKDDATYTIRNLIPDTTYFIVVRTYTPMHDDQQNALWSDYSAGVAAKTDVCYNLSIGVDPVGTGSVNRDPAPDCEGGKYTAGTLVQLTATPSAGFAFGNWSGDAGGVSHTIQITMSDDMTIFANFIVLA